jgi:hypothetical protein
MQILRQETTFIASKRQNNIEKYHFKCFYVGFTILKEHGKIFAKTLPYPSKNNQYEYENINHRRLWTNRYRVNTFS